MEGLISKRAPRVNYVEDSDCEKEGSIMEVISEVEEERETAMENGSFGQLIIEEKTTPKNVAPKESVYFYLEFHPGVYKLVADKLSTFLCKDHKIKLRSGIPNRYGATTTTIICYYTMKIGGNDKTLQVKYYPTKSAMDINMTGNLEKKAEKHVELGMKNGAF